MKNLPSSLSKFVTGVIMLHFFLTSGHAYTVRPFIGSWPDRLRTPIKLIPYSELIRKRELPRGAFIFADIERLSTGQARALEPVWEQIAAQLPAEAVLNHPTCSMSRFNLLKYAYEQGINDFNVYWVSEGGLPERYPVFIRQASEHNGNLTPLLHSEKELHKALESLPNKAKIYHDLMIVEFCDISDDQGIYRKYAAFRVGDAIIPRHLFFGQKWMQKFAGNMEDNDSMLEEECAYMEQNPHEPLLRKVADAAGLRYGRIDYGIKDGRVQIWEMNTNPTLIHAKKMPKYGIACLKTNGFWKTSSRRSARSETRFPDRIRLCSARPPSQRPATTSSDPNTQRKKLEPAQSTM